MDKAVYRLKNRSYPYVPSYPNYGPGRAIPYPEFSMQAVGYSRDPKAPGVLTILDPDKYGRPNGGRWRIITRWSTGWMAIQSLITNEVISSVPPETLEILEENYESS